jgi:RNA polymerase sigma factor (sigma-70 family)
VETLVDRYYVWVFGLIRLWAHGTRLKLEDIEDAVQDAFFALKPAIAHFDPSRATGERSACFRKFFRKLVLDRFHNFVKARSVARRRERALGDRDLVEGSQCPALVILDGIPTTICGVSSPVRAAIWNEALARLEQRLRKLSWSERILWKLLGSGKRRCVIAEELGTSNEALKQRRQRLVTKLRASLRHDYT